CPFAGIRRPFFQRRAGSLSWRAGDFLATYPIDTLPEQGQGPRFIASSIQVEVVRPVGLWRQTHEDGFDASVGFQPEFRTSIVHQIKFDVPAPSYVLPIFLFLRERFVAVSVDKFGINRRKGAA